MTQTPPSAPDLGQLEALLAALPYGVLLCDQAVVLWGNPGAARLLDREQESLAGTTLDELNLPPPRADCASQHTRLTFGERLLEVHSSCLGAGESGLAMVAFCDLTPTPGAKQPAGDQGSFEEMVTSTAARFILLEVGEIDAALRDSLEKVGASAGVDRSYLYQLTEGSMTLTHFWTPEESIPSRYVARPVPREEFSWALEKLESHEPVVYEVQEGERPRSTLLVPMEGGNQLIGFVGFDRFVRGYRWEEQAVHLLQTVGYIFASALESKRSREEIGRAKASLEREVAARTLEIKRQQAQLVQAEKMAALGQLVAGVAHEINTPLGAIMSNTDTLMRTLARLRMQLGKPQMPPEVRENKKIDTLITVAAQVNQVSEQAIERIVRIVGSLRKFARLDQAESGIVDLHHNLDDTLALVHHQLRNRVKVLKEYGEIPAVECYPNQLNQVFMNLLVNASQAIETTGTITLKTWAQGKSVYVEVRDDGRGIEPAQLSRIFDPGFTTKGAGVGTGLGLSIVHQIVAEHAGEIEVESEPGKGTSFRLRLPTRRPSG